MDYAPLVTQRQDSLVASRGGNATCGARVNVNTIGIGNQLDSKLLLGMADQFLHMPDPGAVGPFMVNLLANARCTAMIGEVAANQATLVVRPAAALQGAANTRESVRAESDGSECATEA